jgi:hypothetical protein
MRNFLITLITPNFMFSERKKMLSYYKPYFYI